MSDRSGGGRSRGRHGRRDAGGGGRLDEETLLWVVKGGVVAFFALLLLAVFVRPLTNWIKSSSGALLAYVLVMFVCITAAVGALVLLNRRN